MPATTEIATLNLVAGSDIGDPNNPASQVLKESGDTLFQQDGLQQIQFGMQVENPELLTLFQNWDSKGHHEQFIAAESYQPFLKKFQTIFTGKPDIIHVDFAPEGGLMGALSAPMTEVATFYFNDHPPEGALEGVRRAIDAIKAEGHNVYGHCCGETYETIEREGVKGKGIVLVIGWDSVQAHMDARKGEAYKANVGNLRNGAGSIEVHHIQFMNFVKE